MKLAAPIDDKPERLLERRMKTPANERESDIFRPPVTGEDAIRRMPA